MSTAGQDDTDKSHEATPQKLLEVRKKGEVPKSNDLLAAAAYAGLLVALVAAGRSGLLDVGTAMMILLDQPDHLRQQIFGSGAVAPPMLAFFWPVILGVLPLFVLPALAVIAAVFAQRAWVFAPSKLAPKRNRISPISNAKNKYGRDGLFEFAKSATKMTVFSTVVALFIAARLDEMIAVLQGSPLQVLTLLAELCVAFLLMVVLVSGVIGGVDAVWQHYAHLRKNRMSRKELMDETKNAEGDPYLKQERRQRAMSVAQNQMMAAVPKADVVIVNPTHYAVALTWSRKKGEAPVCVAKGVDEIAQAIRRSAQEAGVPVHSDPPTARALHASTDIGAQIAPDFYRAVAAAIRFAEDMQRRAKGRI